MAEKKKCSRCKKPKTLDSFGKRSQSADGLNPKCKACVSKDNAKYKEKNPEAQRVSHLKTKYKITPEEVEAMKLLQGHRCKICERHESESAVSLSVDHNHKTGQVRGLLCINCNNGLGKFHDDPILLEKAVQYLRSF